MSRGISHLIGDVAGLCGLTRADVEAALKKICTSDREIKKHISTMTKQFNGYHFSDEQKVEPTFNTETNTETCLSYL